MPPIEENQLKIKLHLKRPAQLQVIYKNKLKCCKFGANKKYFPIVLLRTTLPVCSNTNQLI